MTVAAGTVIDTYRVMRLLGRGGMGEVHLARDLQLGRKVAIKLIRGERVGSDDAIQQFLFEARTTAQFSHPHIVTLHGAGKFDGMPYVVLEYLEGQDLRARMNERRLGGGEIARIGAAIADALQEAHRHRVLHRDLKPANVFLARDGRLRVVDFGLATLVHEGDSVGEARPALARITGSSSSSSSSSNGGEPSSPEAETADLALDETAESHPALNTETAELPAEQPRRIAGTPPYMAPEQWRGAGITEAVDIWALGVILYELAVGARPYAADSIDALMRAICSPSPVELAPLHGNASEALITLIGQCLDKDSAARPSASAARQRLEAMLPRRRELNAQEDGPFRGLLPFSEAHAGLFFGRDAEVGRALERLREQPVLPIVGPSGAGKSSLVRAGVIPRLREQGPWHVVSMRPGAEPLRALWGRLHGEPRSSERGTSSQDGPAPARPTMPAELLDDPLEIARILRKKAAEAGRMLLFIDQLEELFTLADAGEAAAFWRGVLLAADDRAEPLRLVFTLREDFLGKAASNPEAQRALSQLLLLRAPDRDALLEVITGPLAAVGHRFDDPSLAAEMVQAIGASAASLPLLSFTLQQLWGKRDRETQTLLRAEHDAIGGVSGALARHAEQVLRGMTDPEIEQARALLLRMVTAEGTRAVATEATLLGGLPESATTVLQRLVAARLVAPRRASDQGRAYELAHEALIGSWRALRRWLDESRDDIAFLTQAMASAQLWHDRGRRDDEAWEGEALAEAARHVERLQHPPPRLVQEFLSAGERQQRKKLTRSRVARWAGVLALVALAAGSTAAAVAIEQRRKEAERNLVLAEQRKSEAEQQRLRAESQRYAADVERARALREAARDQQQRGDMVRARANLRAAMEVEDHPAGRALLAEQLQLPLAWRSKVDGFGKGIGFSDDGLMLAVAGRERSAFVFDVRTGSGRMLSGADDQVYGLSFVDRGHSLVAVTGKGSVFLWTERPAGAQPLGKHGTTRHLPLFTRDGRRHVYGETTDTVGVWDLAARATIARVRRDGLTVDGYSISTDGRFFAVRWSKGPERFYASATAQEVPLAATGSVVFVGGMGQGGSYTQQLRRARAGPARDDGLRDVLTYESWARGGRFLAVGNATVVRVMSYPGYRLRYEVNTRRVRDVAVSPQGRRLAIRKNDGGIELHRVVRSREGYQLNGHTGAVWKVAVAPGARQAISAGFDGAVKTWDLATGEVVREAQLQEVLASVAVSHDGQLIAAGARHVVWLLDRENTAARRVLAGGNTWSVLDLDFHPTQRLLATAADDLRVWNADTMRIARAGEHRGWGYTATRWSPTGVQLAGAWEKRALEVWSWPGWRRTVLQPMHKRRIMALQWLGEAQLVSGSHRRRIAWHDAATGKALRHIDVPYRALSFALSGDGRTLAVAGSDNDVHLLDPRTGEERGRLRGHRDEANCVRFVGNEALLLTSSDDATVRLWDAGKAVPVWHHRPRLAVPPMPSLPPGATTATTVDEHTIIGYSDGRIEARRDGKPSCSPARSPAGSQRSRLDLQAPWSEVLRRARSGPGPHPTARTCGLPVCTARWWRSATSAASRWASASWASAAASTCACCCCRIARCCSWRGSRAQRRCTMGGSRCESPGILALERRIDWTIQWRSLRDRDPCFQRGAGRAGVPSNLD